MSIYIDNKFIRLISSRLRNFKQKKEDLFQFSCPYCGDSKKNKLKARGFVFRKNDNLFYKCFNCPTSTNIAGLLEKVDPSLYKEYILEKFIKDPQSKKEKKTFKIPVPKFDKIKKEKCYENADWCVNYPENHLSVQYLTHRRIPIDFYDKILYTNNYRKFIEEVFPTTENLENISEDQRIVIPFFNEYNELIATSGRAFEMDKFTLRYLNVRGNDTRNKLIFGMDRVNLNRQVKILEGPFDSLFLNNSVASADANLSLVAKEIQAKDMILVFDNENRNFEIVRLMEKAIQEGFKIVIWPDTIMCKDVNEMILIGMRSPDIEDIISKNTFSGLKAKMKLSTWRRV
jgi:transcription elongation factor Elf1